MEVEGSFVSGPYRGGLSTPRAPCVACCSKFTQRGCLGCRVYGLGYGVQDCVFSGAPSALGSRHASPVAGNGARAILGGWCAFWGSDGRVWGVWLMLQVSVLRVSGRPLDSGQDPRIQAVNLTPSTLKPEDSSGQPYTLLDPPG